MTEGIILHATCVAVDGRGVLIVGPSGAGKSSLAVRLISLGAQLVADDRTALTRQGDDLIADVPTTIAGLIEARGVGLLRLPFSTEVPVALCVDMGRLESDRLPQFHMVEVLDIALPCLHKSQSPHFTAAILLCLKGERISPS